jgi:hypothetical protein
VSIFAAVSRKIADLRSMGADVLFENAIPHIAPLLEDVDEHVFRQRSLRGWSEPRASALWSPMRTSGSTWRGFIVQPVKGRQISAGSSRS